MSVWDPETGRKFLKIDAHEAPTGLRAGAWALDVNRGGTLIASAGSDEAVKVWNAATGKLVFRVPHVGFGEDVDWSPDGTLLATASLEGIAKIVDRSGREVAAPRQESGFDLRAIEFSPDGRLLAIARDKTIPPNTRRVEIWDWKRGEILRSIATLAFGLAFDPTGNRIATADITGSVVVWDVDSGRKLVTLAGVTAGAEDVAFSPDGSLIATASADGTVRLSDAGSGVQVLVLPAHSSAGAAFSPDGTKLASTGGGIARVWALDLNDLIKIARRQVTRALTDEECRQHLHIERC